MMLKLWVYLLLAFTSISVFAADLKTSLSSLGISAVYPGDPSYSSASSAYNLRFTLRPAAVVYPTSPQQVSQTLSVGLAQSLKVVARSGGHSYIANGLGGQHGVLVVDMKNFKKVTINSSKGTAVIESGNRLGDVALALGNAGRALPHGTCAYVGFGGHSAYGGFGFTSRMWGLTLDTIVSVNMVLANGTIITASNQQNSNLFWAARGSAGSFGITTSIEVNTFPAPPSATVFRYQWNLDAANTARGIAAFQSFVQTNIPPQFGAEITLSKGSRSGTVTFALVGGWYGPANNLNPTIAPFLSQMPANPRTTITPGTYLNSVTNLAGGSLSTTSPDIHDTFYAKSLMTPESSPMSSAALNAFSQYLANQGFSSQTNWFVQVELYGGRNSAINAVQPDATAFAFRRSTFTIQFYASAPAPYPQSGFTFLDGMVSSITSNSPSNWEYGAYSNYVDDRLVDWKARYYGANYARLQTLKSTYDPQNLFTFPTAIGR